MSPGKKTKIRSIPGLSVWVLPVGIAVCTLLWAYWPSWLSLVQIWLSDPDYNHGFLVAPIAGWLLWHRRDELAQVEIEPSWWGLPILGLACLVRVLGSEFFFVELDTWSIPLWIAGVTVLFGGIRLLRLTAGPIAFLWFMTPLPVSVTQILSLPLQRISALLATWTLHLFALPAVRLGTTISLGEHVLDVERACSGLRICYGVFAFAVALVIHTRPRLVRGGILLASAIPVAIVANSVRVTVTGLLYQFVSGESAQHFSHDLAGLLMIPTAVALLMGLNWTLECFVQRFATSWAAGFSLFLRVSAALIVVGLSLVIWQQRQSDAAVSTLLKMADRYEETASESDEPIEKMKALLQATNVLDRYCRARPTDAEALIRLATVAEQAAQNSAGMARAARCYKRAWKLNEDDLNLRRRQAILAVSAQDYRLAKDAIDWLLENKKIKPGTIDYRDIFRLKVQTVIAGASRTNPVLTWTDVAEVLQEGIVDGTDVGSNAFQLAVIFHQKPIDFGVLFGETISKREGATEARKLMDVLVGEGKQQEGEQEADSEAELIRKLKPRRDDPLAWFARYRYLSQFVPSETVQADHDLDKAIELASTELNQEESSIWLAAGARSLRLRNRLKIEGNQTKVDEHKTEGRDHLRKAIEAAPDNYRGHLWLSRIESGGSGETLSAERAEAALTVLRNALSRERLGRELLLKFELVQVLLRSDQSKAAQAEIDELQALFRDLPDRTRKALELSLTLMQAEVIADRGDVEGAIEMLQPKLRSPDIQTAALVSQGLVALGGYYERQGLYEQAADCFNEAEVADPSSPEIPLFMGLLEERIDNTAQAAEFYEDAASRIGNRTGLSIAVAVSVALARARVELREQASRPADQRDFQQFDKKMARADLAGARRDQWTTIQAEYLLITGDNAALEEAVKEAPESPALWKALALLRSRNGDQQGAMAAIVEYKAHANDVIESTRLQVRILLDQKNYDSARDLLNNAIAMTSDLESERKLVKDLSQVERLDGNTEASGNVLVEFGKRHPQDLKSQVDLAEYYWSAGKLKDLEQVERQLERQFKGIAGAKNVERELRARRLIAQEGVDGIREAKDLLNFVEEGNTNRQKTNVVRGRIAMLEGRYVDAVRHFEEAWRLGRKNVSLAVEVIASLKASGNEARAEYYIGRIRRYLGESESLYDLAMSSGWQAGFEDADDAIRIAQQWVNQQGDVNSYLRLARCLALTATGDAEQRKTQLDKAEEQYKTAIGLPPKNVQESVQAWGEYFQFTLQELNDKETTLLNLREFANVSGIPPLEREFATATILSQAGERDSAAGSYLSALELATERGDRRIIERVAVRAIFFFADFNKAFAEKIARQLLALNIKNTRAVVMLAGLLADKGDRESLRDASDMLTRLLAELSGSRYDSLGEASVGIRTLGYNLDDLTTRVIAAVLRRRATTLKTESDTKKNLAEALTRLNTLQRPSTGDRINKAVIKHEMGDTRTAFLLLKDLAFDENANPQSIGAFVRFWQDHIAASGNFEERAKKALQRLERTPGSQLPALRLRLRPKELDSVQQFQVIVGFLKNVVAPITSDELRGSLLQNTFFFLAQTGRHDLAIPLAEVDEEELDGLTKSERAVALMLMGTIFRGLEGFEKSLGQWLKENESSNNSPDVTRAIADYHFMGARWPEAEKYYRLCLSDNPDDATAANNLALVVFEARGDRDEAARLISVALEASPGNDRFIRDTQAQLLLLDDKADEAYKILFELTSELIVDAGTWLHFAECLHKLDRGTEAEHAFRKSLQLQLAPEYLAPMDRRTYDQLKAEFKVVLGE